MIPRTAAWIGPLTRSSIGSTEEGPFSYDVREAVRTLEAIIAFHASHRAGGAWVELPLRGDDRDIVLHSG